VNYQNSKIDVVRAAYEAGYMDGLDKGRTVTVVLSVVVLCATLLFLVFSGGAA